MKVWQKIWIGMVLVLFCLPVLLFKYPLGHSEPLKGLLLDAKEPGFSCADFISGEYQKQFTAYFNQNFGLRSGAVRIFNQVYYDLFRKSYMYDGKLIIGKEDYIYEQHYLDDYLRVRVSDERLEAFVANTKKLQEVFLKHGKIFCFVITPGKVHTMPEFVPITYEATVAKDRVPYHSLVKMLEGSGIYYIDTQKLVSDEQVRSGQLMFSKGGSHWNEYGSGFAYVEVLRFLNKTYRTDFALPEFVAMNGDMNPVQYDLDVYELLNIMTPPVYEVPHPTWRLLETPGKKPYSTCFIGGSFCWNLVDKMNREKRFNPIDVYFYYRLGHSRFEDGVRREMEPMDKLSEAEWLDEILQHDIIFFELNASLPIAANEEFIQIAKERLKFD